MGDLFRIKGVLAVKGVPDKYVYHAVHMIYEGRFTEQWGASEPRTCKLTFIGKNLDHDGLRSGFEDCLANEGTTTSSRSPLDLRSATPSSATRATAGSA